MPLVLVIDDSPTIRELLSLTLAEAGYRVSSASDGAVGIEMFQSERPDAVVLDLNLPGILGSEVLQLLKGLEPSLPVFLFTVYGDFRDKLGDVTQSDGCFVKSGDITPLLDAIARALRPGIPGADSCVPVESLS